MPSIFFSKSKDKTREKESLKSQKLKEISKVWSDASLSEFPKLSLESDCCQCCKATIKKEVSLAMQNEKLKTQSTLSSATGDGV